MPAEIHHRQLEILKSLCNLPTAPYCEQHVIAWLLSWAQTHPKHLKVQRDPAGNIFVTYGKPRKNIHPLVLEAHMDHPGFVVKSMGSDGTVNAEFRGSVKPSQFTGATAKFWINDPLAIGNIQPATAAGQWVRAKLTTIKPRKNSHFFDVKLSGAKQRLRPGTIGMWDLPDAAIHGQLFSARVCDDLGGVAAIVCVLEELLQRESDAHVIALFSRAEEVGFAGVLAVCERGGIPKGSAVVGLETSKASATASQGSGPIIRVGDRTGLFSPGLTHFLTQAAGHIADAAPAALPFKYQRKLMDGGTCNSTAFAAYGYDSAAMCVALGNYHNQRIKGDVGYNDGAKAGPGIASETIHTGDFLGMVQILVEAATRMKSYAPGFRFMRDRLSAMHKNEQQALLYRTSDQP